jgi:hypothetical protein
MVVPQPCNQPTPQVASTSFATDLVNIPAGGATLDAYVRSVP